MRTADDLVECLVFDCWPHSGAIVDFGIDDQAHYVVLQDAIHDGVTADEFHAVVGNGPAITKLLTDRGYNPDGLVFKTAYDDLGVDDDEQTKPSQVLEHFDKASGVGTE